MKFIFLCNRLCLLDFLTNNQKTSIHEIIYIVFNKGWLFMKKTAITLMMIAIISKVVGLMRDIVLSYFYGTSQISDVYIISITIPTVMFSIVMMGLSSGYIPIYLKIAAEKGNESATSFTNNLISIIIILCTFIVFSGFIFTEQIVRIFASGFQGETLVLAIKFTRLSIFAIYFMGVVSIFTDYLRMKGSYIIPSIIVVFPNVVLVILIIASYYFGVMLLAGTTLIVSILSVILLTPFVRKNGFKYRWYCNLNDENIQKLIFLAMPLILGVAVNQINILVDRTLASRITIGGISALTYAGRLNQIVQGIFVLSLINVMYPIISKRAVDDDHKGFKEIIKETINIINLLVIPATIGLIVFSPQIVKLLFGRGAFDEKAILMTSNVLLFYSSGILGIALREVLARAFYSLQDTKTPMINASIAVFLNIALNIALSSIMGISGLALATSISALFCTFLLFISLRKKIGPFGIKQISISFLKILFASLVMGGLAKLSFNYLTASLSQNLSLLIAIGVGAVSYFVIIYFMKIEDVDVIVGEIKKKLGRGAA